MISIDTEQLLKAKLEWAERHIYSLQEAWDHFCKRAYRVEFNDDLNTGDRIYHLADACPIDASFSLLIGDAVHCLRSALDHLAYHVMSISPGITPKHLGKVYFPIGKDSNEYVTEKRTRIEGIRHDAIEVIDSIEPYGGGAGEILWHLHCLDIIDKHKLLIAVGSTNSLQSMAPSRVAATKRKFLRTRLDAYTPAQDALLFRTEPSKLIFPLKTGDVLAVIPMPEVNEYMNFTFEIAFGEPEIVKGHQVIEALHRMAELIRHIIRTFLYKGLT